MLSVAAPLGVENVALADALNRVLIIDIVASRDQPPFAASAMDGFAVRAADTPGRLRLIGESTSGRGFDGHLAAGTAVRISTGAPLPDGADAIVMQEDVTRDAEMVKIPLTPFGRHVRRRGSNFTAGTVLLRAGQKLDGMALALAAASGCAVLPVARRPRIAILCSGDELVAPGGAPGPVQVFDSASYGIGGFIEEWGGASLRLSIARDDIGALATAAEQGLRDSDLLVVLGGASVGDHDHARPALMRLGLDLAVEKVALRPGRPTWFGITPQGPVLGLPGNPLSALVCACLFLRPILEAMLGRDPKDCTKFHRARLANALPANGPCEQYLRAYVGIDDEGQLSVRADESQDSSVLSSAPIANALIRRAPGASALKYGALVDVTLLGRPFQAFCLAPRSKP